LLKYLLALKLDLLPIIPSLVVLAVPLLLHLLLLLPADLLTPLIPLVLVVSNGILLRPRCSVLLDPIRAALVLSPLFIYTLLIDSLLLFGALLGYPACVGLPLPIVLFPLSLLTTLLHDLLLLCLPVLILAPDLVCLLLLSPLTLSIAMLNLCSPLLPPLPLLLDNLPLLDDLLLGLLSRLLPGTRLLLPLTGLSLLRSLRCIGWRLPGATLGLVTFFRSFRSIFISLIARSLSA
jgi:hypothetical protein